MKVPEHILEIVRKDLTQDGTTYSLCPICGKMVFISQQGSCEGESVILDESNILCDRCERTRFNHPEVFAFVNDVTAFTRAIGGKP